MLDAVDEKHERHERHEKNISRRFFADGGISGIPVYILENKLKNHHEGTKDTKK